MVRQMLLERVLPAYRFREIHETFVNASPDRVFEALRDLRPADAPIIGMLMTLRSLPAFFSGRKGYALGDSKAPFLSEIERTGFLLLDQETNSEIVLGIVGKFWKASGHLCPHVTTAGQFVEFEEEGWAKAAWNFLLEPAEGGTRLVTETRIAVFGTLTTRKFG
ncbi:MAG: hypothetical protein HY563_02035, partial [Ignavibacteriales bacterium]|nr:hypothetical protein [Ignavibacteriales bacterium]